MDNEMSLAAQAVAAGPSTVAPPSFDGHGWLVVLNLAEMTATAVIAAMLVAKLIGDLRRKRGASSRGPLVTLLRVLVLIGAAGMMGRTGVEAISLWGWNPLDPVATGGYQLLKRLLDPIGAAAYAAFICLFIMTEDTLTPSLERQPLSAKLITAPPKLKCPAWMGLLALIAALCACVAVRFYVSHKDREAYRWQVDMSVSALTVLFTAGAVMQLRPNPAVGLLLGTGFGALGAGIIAAALAYVQKLPGLGGADSDPPKSN